MIPLDLPAATLPPEPRRPPIPGPLLVNAAGYGLVEQPDGTHAPMKLEQGLSIGWMPLPELGGMLLVLGDAPGPRAAIATTLTRPGLQGLIADLQSIDAQIEELG